MARIQKYLKLALYLAAHIAKGVRVCVKKMRSGEFSQESKKIQASIINKVF